MTGKEYLEKEGFANIELFTNKGPFERLELISNTLEKYHKSEVKKLNISSVSQRSEPLKAFIRWNNQHNGIASPVPESMADRYLESL